MAVEFWQGTALGTLLGVFGALATFGRALGTLTQIAKDHERRITSVENHRDNLARTRADD